MELAKYKACICEGSAEEAIIDKNPMLRIKGVRQGAILTERIR